MPRSKREVLEENTKLAPVSEFAGMNSFALRLQRRKRLDLIKQMVGTLYPDILSAQIIEIEELLRLRS